MLSQQKTREEARTEHGGRGVEKEATPLHESEKNYAESLAAIVSCRERLQEQQVQVVGGTSHRSSIWVRATCEVFSSKQGSLQHRIRGESLLGQLFRYWYQQVLQVPNRNILQETGSAQRCETHDYGELE